MGLCIDVGIYAQCDGCDLTQIAGHVIQAIEFGGRFDIEAANPDLQCATHLRGTFPDAGKDDLGRISTGRQYAFQLTHGDDIETGAEAGKRVEYPEIRVCLDRKTDQVWVPVEGATTSDVAMVVKNASSSPW